MEDHSTHFNSIFNKYRQINDKHQSLYIFVITDLTVGSVIEKVKKIITSIDNCSNPSKKAYLKNKLNKFIENLIGTESTNIQSESNIILNKIFFISDFVNSSIDSYDITKFWKETLEIFKCDQFIVNNDDTFNLDWLKDLLLSRTYVNVLCFNNNNLKHFHLTHTKKKLVKEKQEKKMDVNLYINENTNKGDLTIIHGISSFLKNLQETTYLKILTDYKKDEELLEEYDKILNNNNAIQLQWWLDRILDPKEGKKIVFGKDIGIGINDSTIKTIFCSPERKTKLLENFPNNNLNDKLIVVKSYGNDVGNQLQTNFKGAIGIKFY